MTPKEITIAYEGYRKRMEEQWEMVRNLAYYSVAPHMGKKSTWSREKVKLPIDFVSKKSKKKKSDKAPETMKVTRYKRDGK